MMQVGWSVEVYRRGGSQADRQTGRRTYLYICLSYLHTCSFSCLMLMCACMYIYMCMCIYICIHTYMHVHMSVYIYIYIYYMNMPTIRILYMPIRVRSACVFLVFESRFAICTHVLTSSLLSVILAHARTRARTPRTHTHTSTHTHTHTPARAPMDC